MPLRMPVGPSNLGSADKQQAVSLPSVAVSPDKSIVVSLSKQAYGTEVCKEEMLEDKHKSEVHPNGVGSCCTGKATSPTVPEDSEAVKVKSEICEGKVSPHPHGSQSNMGDEASKSTQLYTPTDEQLSKCLLNGSLSEYYNLKTPDQPITSNNLGRKLLKEIESEVDGLLKDGYTGHSPRSYPSPGNPVKLLERLERDECNEVRDSEITEIINSVLSDQEKDFKISETPPVVKNPPRNKKVRHRT